MNETFFLATNNISSFSYNREEGLEILHSNEKYKNANNINKQLVCFVVPNYRNNENKKNNRCDIEVDGIHLIYQNMKLYYFSPIFKQIGITSRSSMNYVTMNDAKMPFDVEKNAIWIIDERVSYECILHFLAESKKEEKKPHKIIFFINENNPKLIKALGY